MPDPARILVAIALAMIFIALGYVLGAWSVANEIWPIPRLRDAKRAIMGEPPIPTGFDKLGRLIQRDDKVDFPCPTQDARMAVILFIGQSIQSNSAGQRYESENGDKVAAWFGGRCTIARSPLLGATSAMGEALTPLGNRLVASGAFDRVVLVPSAIGGTKIDRWAEGGDLNAMLLGVISDVSRRYRITHVIWHQGEDDFRRGTTAEDYTRRFHSLLASIRAAGVDAPVFVSVATRCDDDAKWTPDNPISRAQRALQTAGPGLRAGVDTDALLLPGDRYDGCHLGASGVEKYANALASLMRP